LLWPAFRGLHPQGFQGSRVGRLLTR
jgi:hypothetical protein